MFQRYYIKCPVCNKITVLRIQAGFLPKHPVRFNCGNCKISLYGEAFFDAPRVTLNMYRGEIIPENNVPDYLLAVSGEFLCSKLKQINKNEDVCTYLSPFMDFISTSGQEVFTYFKNYILNCIDYIEKMQNNYIICNQLYFLKQIELLKEKLSYLPSDLYPLNNEFDIYRAYHFVNRQFYETINKHEANAIARFIFGEIENFENNNISGLLKLVMYFEDKNLLDKWEYNIFQLNNQFIESFYKFIPILACKYYQSNIEDLEKIYSINTISFEEVEPLYFKCYELLSDTLALLMAFNNLKYRNDFTIMKDGIKFRKKAITTLDEYIAIESKGFKIDCIDGTEMYDNIVFGTFDRAIRNSIGHFNYEILTQDVFNQTILFKDLKDDSKNESRSLLKICFDMWKMYIAIQNISEIIYQTKKITFVLKGIRPSVKF